ncbi:hypothetical protein [Pseudoclavibacter helvolus]|uniref:hypothetical protein n=1 Tax=Pseudoclavibacter helvolus TaxID=255205 RepID=UPI0037350FA6
MTVQGTTYRLRDMDNRGDDGDPWETTGSLTKLASYVDGPLRGDLRDEARANLDPIVAEMREGRLSNAHREELRRRTGVYISEVEERVQAWQHSRKGYIEGVFLRSDDTWTTIRCTKPNRQAELGEQFTFRTAFATEVEVDA